jgi:hypothetical protein
MNIYNNKLDKFEDTKGVISADLIQIRITKE